MVLLVLLTEVVQLPLPLDYPAFQVYRELLLLEEVQEAEVVVFLVCQDYQDSQEQVVVPAALAETSGASSHPSSSP